MRYRNKNYISPGMCSIVAVRFEKIKKLLCKITRKQELNFEKQNTCLTLSAINKIKGDSAI